MHFLIVFLKLHDLAWHGHHTIDISVRVFTGIRKT